METTHHALKFTELFCLRTDQSLEDGVVDTIIFDQFSIILCRNNLYIHVLNEEFKDTEPIRDDIIAIAKMDPGKVAALAWGGSLLILNCKLNYEGAIEVDVTNLSLDYPSDCFFHHGERAEIRKRIVFTSIGVDTTRNAVWIFFNKALYLFVIDNLREVNSSSTKIDSVCIYSGSIDINIENETQSVSFSIWGHANLACLVYCCGDTWIDTISLGLEGQVDRETSEIGRFETHHSSWITSLSSMDDSGSSTSLQDISFSGDSTGCIIMWKHRILDTYFHMEPLLIVEDFCYLQAITCICVDPIQMLLWVGDSGSVVSNAIISEKKLSLDKQQQINFQGSTGPISWISWRPNFGNALANGYQIRIFSFISGTAVEVVASNTASLVFRAWPDTASSSTFGSGPRRSSLCISHCAVWQHRNILATAGASPLIYIWDLHSGLLVHTICVDGSLISTLTCFDEDGSGVEYLNIGYLLVGHHTGAVDFFTISESRENQQQCEKDFGDGVNSMKHLSIADTDLIDLVSSSNAEEEKTEGEKTEGEKTEEDQTKKYEEEGEKRKGIGNLHSASVSSCHQHNRPSIPTVNYDDKMSGEEGSSNGDTLPKFNHTLVRTLQLCCLPVSDVFFSAGGKYCALCFARKFISVIHIPDNRVVQDLKFKEPFLGILLITYSESEHELRNTADSNSDTLDLVLTTLCGSMILVLNALTGVFTKKYPIEVMPGYQNDQPCFVRAAGLWSVPGTRAIGPGPSSSSCVYAGVFIIDDLQVIPFDERVSDSDGKLMSINKTGYSIGNKELDSGLSDFDRCFVGINISCDKNRTSAFVVWSHRVATIFRFVKESGNLLDNAQYKILDDEVHIVHATALPMSARRGKQSARNHRTVVILSDGTAAVISSI